MRAALDAAYVGFAALCFALALGWLGPALDIKPLTEQEQATADCRQVFGEAVAVLLPDGSHRCMTKHGRRIK